MKGFKDSKKKFHPIRDYKRVRKSRDQTLKTHGVRFRRTNEQRLEIKNAEELGAKAFRDGKSSIPAQDPNAMSLMKGRKVGDPLTLPLLKAWSRGWHNENIKAINDINRGSDLVKLLPEKDEDDREKYNETIIDQLNSSRVNGFPFVAYTGLKKYILKNNDTVQFNQVPNNPNNIEKITIMYDVGQDLYNMKLYTKNNPVPQLYKGIFFDQMADIIVDGMGIR